jgi:hypothetical protein
MTKILLWNPISNKGHLNSYLALYTKILKESGYEVVAVAQLNIEEEIEFQKNFPGVLYKPGARNDQGKKIFSLIGILMKNILSKIIELSKILLTILGFQSGVNNKVSWKHLVSIVKNDKENFNGIKLIICMYLDVMSDSKTDIYALDSLGIKWAGLLFHPKLKLKSNDNTYEQYFKSEQNVGAIFFSGTYDKEYTKILGGNRLFLTLPDVNLLPEISESKYSKKLFVASKKREIVLLSGPISPYKSLNEFVRLACDPDFSHLFFVIFGEILWDLFEQRDIEALNEFESNSNNCLILGKEYISSQSVFDGIIKNSQYLYAVYSNHFSSANIIFKASYYEVPILVGPVGKMRDEVLTYGIGEVALTTAYIDIKNAFIQLLLGHREKKYTPGFRAYSNLINANTLQISLSRAVMNWITSED